MASATALHLPNVRVAAARPAPAGAPAPPLRLCHPRAHLLLAARTPPRSVSVRGAPSPGDVHGPAVDAWGSLATDAFRPLGVDVHGPAVDALWSAAADAFHPLLDNFKHVLSLRNFYDVNDYHIGMPCGVLLASIGCYQMFKMDPWTFLDVVLGYAFYKLSVVSSQVHRRGFANDFMTIIKCANVASCAAIIIVMHLKLPLVNNLHVLDSMRVPIFHLYLIPFYFDTKGWKQRAERSKATTADGCIRQEAPEDPLKKKKEAPEADDQLNTSLAVVSNVISS